MEAQLSGGVRHSWLKHFHITFFGMVFGMTGFTLAVQMASTIFSPLLLPAGHLIRYATVILMITIVSIYLLKLVRFPEAVSSEWNHPNKINFFPLFGMSLLVLGSSFFKSHPKVSLILWVSGTVLQFLSSVIVVSIWAGQTHFRIEHMTPGWFIPIVGSIIVPIAGVKHGFIELSWFFFTVGLFFLVGALHNCDVSYRVSSSNTRTVVTDAFYHDRPTGAGFYILNQFYRWGTRRVCKNPLLRFTFHLSDADFLVTGTRKNQIQSLLVGHFFSCCGESAGKHHLFQSFE